jgi:hypothetical protein
MLSVWLSPRHVKAHSRLKPLRGRLLEAAYNPQEHLGVGRAGANGHKML